MTTFYTAVLSSLVGCGVFTSLIAKYPTANVVPFVLLTPPVGIVSAWVFQSEAPNAADLLGGAVLLAGVAITTLAPSRSA